MAKTSGAGGKAKKKKWSKGKAKEKANHAVALEQAAVDKIYAEVPSYRVVTPGILADRHKICLSVARTFIKDLESKGLLRKVSGHAALSIYTSVSAKQ